MKKISLLFMLTVFVSFFAGCKSSIKELNISAASSLKECLIEIEKLYGKAYPDTKVLLNFGASGTLQQQIEQGAPVDVFISAGKKQMDELQSKELLQSGSKADLLTNSVVLIAPKEATFREIQSLTTDEVKKIGQGDPKVVPIGAYAQEVLAYYHLTDQIADKVVYGKDAKEVLAWVETGNIDAGFVFKTDALVSEKVKVVFEVPADAHQLVTYPMAIVKESKMMTEATTFVTFLQSAQAKVVFEKYGFTMANQ